MTERERDIAAEIRRIARDDLGIEADPGDHEELASRLDSLALLSLVVAVEDRFRVLLDDAETVGARSLADLARLVAHRSETAGEAP